MVARLRASPLGIDPFHAADNARKCRLNLREEMSYSTAILVA